MKTTPVWALGVSVALFLFEPSAHSAGRSVSFRADDGRMVAGLLMEADQRPAPAVLLVPMLGRPKDDWQAVAQRFADSRITALAIDLPGSSVPVDPNEIARWTNDVRAAVAYLSAQSGQVRPGAIGILGASLGGSLAALAAAAEPGVRSIALVSPSLDYRGIRIETAMRTFGARPALLVGSVRDPYSARSMRALAEDAPGRRELRWSDVPAHGTLLLSRDGDLVRAIVEWFQVTLG
jgi:dienelactone hydrolase